jgi:steroid 5-alpha reductase family enzyme
MVIIRQHYRQMFEFNTYLNCLIALLIFAFFGWLLSLLRKNVTHVDSMWSLFFVLATIVTILQQSTLTTRAAVVLALVSIWALRLFLYLTWRNWGPHEDGRYVQIRQNNQPNFWLKSIYIIFGLQAVLAWVVSSALFGAASSPAPLNGIDYVGFLLVIIGLFWETIADWQLTAFKANHSNKRKVLDTGLWRYSRHPNYFGECLVWWGFYLVALAAGAWWAIISPVLMTLLLLKISGVSLLESTIIERRPAYAEYIKNTNAFFPSFFKK